MFMLYPWIIDNIKETFTSTVAMFFENDWILQQEKNGICRIFIDKVVKENIYIYILTYQYKSISYLELHLRVHPWPYSCLSSFYVVYGCN